MTVTRSQTETMMPATPAQIATAIMKTNGLADKAILGPQVTFRSGLETLIEAYAANDMPTIKEYVRALSNMIDQSNLTDAEKEKAKKNFVAQIKKASAPTKKKKPAPTFKFKTARKDFGIKDGTKQIEDLTKAAESIVNNGLTHSKTVKMLTDILIQHADMKKLGGKNKSAGDLGKALKKDYEAEAKKMGKAA